MSNFASLFKKKYNKILVNEEINAAQLAKIAGITIVAAYDYKSGRATPSSANYTKLIIAFPKYACYLIGINPKTLPKQIIPKY